ncbi:MAG: ABC transporter ATP-binding protein [Myxococcota bacterium]
MSTVIQGSDLKKVYQQGTLEVHALRGVDLTVEAGEFAALVGPSGSGKSTLLNLVGTLDKPTSGSIQVAGQEVSGLDRAASAKFRLKHIGFVFQAYNLLPVLTAYENAEYTLMLQGVPVSERKAVVTPLLERVGLSGMFNRKPHELSGGQQQRVAVARALASKPSLVLADEPTANLDSETGEALLDLMVELNQHDGVTFVFASHDPAVVSRVRRVVTLRDGLVVSDERL